MIEIDRGIPMPEKGPVGRKRKYPFNDMKVGDSFLYTDHLDDHILACNRISAIAATHAVKFKPKKKFTCRTSKEGVRVFRIE